MPDEAEVGTGGDSGNSSGLTVGPRPFPPDDHECELCAAARYTHWYQVNDHGWVADCEVCQVPMVVWWHHGSDAPAEVVEELLAMLSVAAEERFGKRDWSIDRTMRQVPGHFHAHARDEDWWTKRWTRPMSRYTEVGGGRQT